MSSLRLLRIPSLLALSALLSLAACGGDNPSTPPVAESPDVAEGGDTTATDDAGSDDAGADVGVDTPPTDVGTDAAESDTPVEGDTGPDTFFDPDVPTNGDGGVEPGGPLGVLALDPSAGPEDGDTPIVVFGYGFTVDTQILINGRLAEDTDFVDFETILARTPPNPAGIYDVKVANSTDEAILVQGFRYFADLSAERVDPATGPERGGAPVTLYGAGFTDDALVSVGGRLGIDIRVIDDNRIEFILPPGVAGDADVRVTSENGSEVLRGGFTYYAEPTLDGVTPGAGANTGGYEVFLTGSGLTDDTSVFFGPSSAEATLVDATRLSVIVPAGVPGPTDVSVSSPLGGDTLVGGFYYVADADGALDVMAVTPNSGGESGGFTATVAGPGVGNATTITFGATEASILATSSGAAVVQVPAGTGSVDVTVETADASDTLTDGFTYLAELEIDDVTPDSGDSDGGDSVTITGANFVDGVTVRFGPIPAASVEVVSASEISAVTPPGSLGAVDVTVSDRSRSATLTGGFTYTEEADVSSMVPTRGAIAGNTLVVIRGRGFHGDVQVFFGENEAPVVTVVDAATLEVRTPQAETAERVAVRVVVEDVEVRTGKNFVYYDPFTPAGGWWGDAINGHVNVTVLDSGSGARIENAFVTLHIRADEASFVCRTNAIGQCTISYPGVVGRQTISASALDYSAVTVNNVDAENVVIALSSTVPPTPGSPPAYTPPTIWGTLEGLDKIVDPGEDEIIIGVIRTTTPGVGASNPPGTGFTQVTWTSGDDPIPYEMFSREGELAVTAFCGVFNETTGEFTPLYMGLRRGMAVRGEGTRYEVNLDCDIHLSQTLTFKFRNPPLAPGGAEVNQALPYLDFGGEGASDFLHIAEGRTEIISESHFAPLTNPQLAGVDYEVIGQSVPNAGGLPFSIVFARDILDPDDRIDFPTSMPPADLVYPSPGGTVVERRFEWRLPTDERADFFYAYIQDLPQDITFWEVWLPGDESGFNLPYFPPGEDSVALPSGPLVLIVLSIDAITFDYDAFEFNDFGRWNWRAYSAAGWVFNNP